MPEKRWVQKTVPDNEIIDQISNSLKIKSKILAILIAQRGLTDFNEIKKYFNPGIDDLHDPFLMKDMDKAIKRIEQAVDKNESVMVYGDYDVDGTTAVSVVYTFFKAYFKEIQYYIPDRFDEGYGISEKGILKAAENNVNLIITLDCGIKSIEKAELAQQKGIDMIICDHHTPGDTLPFADAILNPKQKDCQYPYKELSGCGIGFKLITAWAKHKNLNPEKYTCYLDLVASSIASDIVPLTGENRVLAHLGLEVLNKNPSAGLKALSKTAGLKSPNLNIGDLVFKIGPRINAAGRINHAHDAVELLMEIDDEKALYFAAQINLNNTKRQKIDSQTTNQALDMIRSKPELQDAKSTVLFNPEWHKGVIGIVASRLTEHYYRPTVMLTESNNLAVGSARSVPGFNLYNAINACKHLLVQFGGHQAAAGLTLEKSNIEKFRNSFEEIVAEMIQEDQLTPKLVYDIEIELGMLNNGFCKTLQRLGPFGPENMQTVFVSRNVKTVYQAKLLNNSHLKLVLKQNGSKNFNAIGFNMAEYYNDICNGRQFDICYTIDENFWNGMMNYQIRLKDVRFN